MSQIGTSPLPSITTADIERLSDPASFSRGKGYRRDRMIQRTIRRGPTLSALCAGSSGGPYEVRATLSTSASEKIADWFCSCPLGYFCKHLVAMMLTWVETPEVFETRRPLEEALADRDRDELVAIIQKLIALEPMLELVIEKMMPASPSAIVSARAGEAAQTLSVKQIRQRLNDALDAVSDDEEESDWDDDWDAGPVSSFEEYLRDEHASIDVDVAFAEAVEIAELHERAGRDAEAASVFAEVAWLGMDRFDDSNESEGVYRNVLASGRGLVHCLERQATLPESDRLDSLQRTKLLEAIYEIWLFAGHGNWEADGFLAPADSGDGNLELSGPDFTALVRASITSDERRITEERWRSEAESNTSEEWRRRSAIEFGIALNEPGGLNEAEILDLITKAELWWDQALFLLRQYRFDEAMLVAARKLTESNAALGFANLLSRTGDDGLDRAIRFIDERLWETEGKSPIQDIAYLDWLASAYERSGKLSDALDVRLRAFKVRPDFAGYKELKKIATQPGLEPGRWPSIRESALKLLADKGLWQIEMEVYLDEGNAREALRLLKNHKEHARSSGGSMWSYALQHYEERVAKVAEQEFPDEAIRVYRRLADQQIGYRSRSNYHRAAEYLTSVKEVLESHDRAEEWKSLIRALRAEHVKLRALQDELNMAGLK